MKLKNEYKLNDNENSSTLKKAGTISDNDNKEENKEQVNSLLKMIMKI